MDVGVGVAVDPGGGVEVGYGVAVGSELELGDAVATGVGVALASESKITIETYRLRSI